MRRLTKGTFSMSNLRFAWLPAPRSGLALLFIATVYIGFDHLAFVIDRPLARALGLHTTAKDEMELLPYALLMVVRLLMDLPVVAGVCAIVQSPIAGFPLVGPRMGRLAATGLAIGLIVMVGAILAIMATGNASVAISAQSPLSALSYGSGWLVFDLVGATGEELFGRVAVLLVAERFVGRYGAAIVSGLMFSALHLGNPGASWIWLARLFFQGVLLAYAVYRTGSVWWSVGYHTGWNWASAPLFGAAGSGYLDQGHILDFMPTGSSLMTGGAVGPEGSIFAFVAMLCAFTLLVATTSGRNRPYGRAFGGGSVPVQKAAFPEDS
ncbi:hypothetical protein C3920_01215 [Novacetimonas pomaceti]|uniref:CAAX prenyl protease 2/Lysostaphin resistance protein A-like domain-containing protein n=2 Tax=Novacetimonas pomaceti TaxID=2021998 RepID=A0ABX5P5V3_9PROT|nr:hypothetical protein C3920_01215 [Novacetimonas pomaceti]